MIKCINRELQDRFNYLDNHTIKSIYFGGGTPSILSADQINTLLSTIYNTYKVSDDVEITLEGNPDDLNKKNLKNFSNIGVNRLSIGVQSFNDRDLLFMNRSHNSEEAINSIKDAQELGFSNITIDLIYGLPNQNIEDWNTNLDIIFGLNLQHFSAYLLTIEEKTKLKYMIDKKQISLLEDDHVIDQYKLLLNKSLENGFINYEISNFGIEGKFSQHNLGYWNNQHYLGVGPSAHSFNGKTRRWNIASNIKYINKINNGENYFNFEVLSLYQQYNEYIFTSFRTIWGVDSNTILDRFNKDILIHYLREIKKWQDKLYVIESNGVFTLTREGKMFSDLISSDLFILES